jgi:hypothetical protein
MYKYSGRIVLLTEYVDNEDVRHIIKMAIALPLLPSTLVWEGFDVIVDYFDNLPANFGRETKAKLTQFLEYVRSFWLERIGLERFCVYRDLNRTNNVVEVQNRILYALVGVAHPTQWIFLGKYQ